MTKMAAPNYHDYVKLVENPTLPYILRTRDTKLVSVHKVLDVMRYSRMVKWRAGINLRKSSDKPGYVCPKCKTPVYLLLSVDHRVYFKHMPTKKSCPLKEKGELSRAGIRELIYAVRTESLRHRRLKQYILDSLQHDQNFENTVSEKVIVSQKPNSTWRRPDIKTSYQNIAIAIEAQVSSTFLDVLQARKKFYADEKMCLLWVMDEFISSSRRVSQDDMIVQHKGTAFVVDSETLEISNKRKKFFVKMYRHSSLTQSWTEKIIAFSELELEPKTGSIYQRLEFNKQNKIKQLVLKICKNSGLPFNQNAKMMYVELSALLSEIGLNGDTKDDYTGSTQSESIASFGLNKLIVRMVCAIETAKSGTSFGFGYDKNALIQTAHSLYKYDLYALTVFGQILVAEGNMNKLLEEDVTKKWNIKAKEVRKHWSTLRRECKIGLFELELLYMLYPKYKKFIEPPSC